MQFIKAANTQTHTRKIKSPVHTLQFWLNYLNEKSLFILFLCAFSSCCSVHKIGIRFVLLLCYAPSNGNSFHLCTRKEWKVKENSVQSRGLFDIQRERERDWWYMYWKKFVLNTQYVVFHNKKQNLKKKTQRQWQLVVILCGEQVKSWHTTVKTSKN